MTSPITHEKIIEVLREADEAFTSGDLSGHDVIMTEEYRRGIVIVRDLYQRLQAEKEGGTVPILSPPAASREPTAADAPTAYVSVPSITSNGTGPHVAPPASANAGTGRAAFGRCKLRSKEGLQKLLREAYHLINNGGTVADERSLTGRIYSALWPSYAEYSKPSFFTCPECGGQGSSIVWSPRFSDSADNNEEVKCTACGGTGAIVVEGQPITNDDIDAQTTAEALTSEHQRGKAEGERIEREVVASWMIAQGFATGHGDTTSDLLSELADGIADRVSRSERIGIEKAAKVADDHPLSPSPVKTVERIVSAIRALNTKPAPEVDPNAWAFKHGLEST